MQEKNAVSIESNELRGYLSMDRKWLEGVCEPKEGAHMANWEQEEDRQRYKTNVVGVMYLNALYFLGLIHCHVHIHIHVHVHIHIHIHMYSYSYSYSYSYMYSRLIGRQHMASRILHIKDREKLDELFQLTTKLATLMSDLLKDY